MADMTPGDLATLGHPIAAAHHGPLPPDAVDAAGVSLRVLAPMQRFLLRGGTAAREGCGRALGLIPSTDVCRAVLAGTRAALWLGPDEWLLLLPDDDAAAQSLSSAIAEDAGAIIDIGHRQVAFEISGPHAADMLNGACPLDLHPTVFPTGMCTRTVLGKAEIVLWRTAPDRFHVEVLRSFAAYAHALLVEIMREFAASDIKLAEGESDR